MPKASFLPEESGTDAPQSFSWNMPVVRSGQIQLIANDIELDPVCKVRTTPHSIEYIHEFAEKLKAEGQSTPILIRPPAPGGTKYRLIAGEARLGACGINGVPVLALVRDVDDETARRLAFSENYRRKQFTPVDLAVLFIEARGALGNGTTPANWSQRVADSFGVSRATVTEHVKMYEALEGDPDILAEVAEGKLSMQAAIDIAKLRGEDRAAVAKRAKELARADAAKKEEKKANKPARNRAEKPQERSAAPPAVSTPPKVEAKHVRQAKREAGEQTGVMSRAEVLEGLAGLVHHSYPACMNAFLVYVTTDWQAGKGNEAGIVQRWRNIAACIEDEKKKGEAECLPETTTSRKITGSAAKTKRAPRSSKPKTKKPVKKKLTTSTGTRSGRTKKTKTSKPASKKKARK